MKHIPIAVALLLVVSPALAQVRDSRSMVSGEDLPTASSDHVYVDTAGLACIRQMGQDAAQFQTGVAAPGAAFVLGYPHIQHLVIAGRDTQGGRLEHWSLSAVSMQWGLTSALAFPGGDFSGIVFEGGFLYLLECITGTVLKSGWDPTLNLSTTAFQVWADAASVPVLSGSDNLTMRYRNQASSPGLPGSGLFLFDANSSSVVKRGVLVAEVGGLIQWNAALWKQRPALLGPIADIASAVDGATSVTIIVSGQQSVEVLDSSATVLGAATSSPTDRTIVVPLTSPLVVGQEYSVRLAGSSSSRPFACVQRFGYPEALADGSRLGVRRVEAERYHINNPSFAVECPLYRDGIRDGSAAPELNYLGVLIIGFASSNVVPFDNGQGVNQLLDSTFWVGALGGIRENHSSGYVEMKMPLADDPTWVGTLVKTQFAIFDGVWFGLSEVTGYTLRAAP